MTDQEKRIEIEATQEVPVSIPAENNPIPEASKPKLEEAKPKLEEAKPSQEMATSNPEGAKPGPDTATPNLEAATPSQDTATSSQTMPSPNQEAPQAKQEMAPPRPEVTQEQMTSLKGHVVPLFPTPDRKPVLKAGEPTSLLPAGPAPSPALQVEEAKLRLEKAKTEPTPNAKAKETKAKKEKGKQAQGQKPVGKKVEAQKDVTKAKSSTPTTQAQGKQKKKPGSQKAKMKKAPLNTTPGDALFFTGRQGTQEAEFDQELCALLGKEYFVEAANFAKESHPDLYLPLDHDLFAEPRLQLALQGNMLQKIHKWDDTLPALQPLSFLDQGFLEGMRQDTTAEVARHGQNETELKHPGRPKKVHPAKSPAKMGIWENRSRDLAKKLLQSPSLTPQEKALIQGTFSV